MAPPEDLRDRARWRLGLFRERADIVLSCDLARRIDLATLGTQMTLLLTEEGTGSIALRGLPPESEIEVAATRLRPIFLQDDEVHHGKVLGALGLLAPAQEHPSIKALRGHWKDLPNSRYWSIATSRGVPTGEAASHRTDREIAGDWLYGHLVHHDPARRERVKHVPHTARVQAGLLWAKDGILLTAATLRYLDCLHEARSL
jgi:hypothetical protein